MIGGEYILKGIPASSGIAIGKTFVISENKIEVKETIIQDTAQDGVLLNPDDETIKKYKDKQNKLLQYNKSLEVLKNAESISRDGKKVELAGNIGSPKDVLRVLGNESFPGLQSHKNLS
ncbi:MAG: ptsP [Clostridiales bacterium]|nr:ptsP [Clostridiales bacterium]